MRNSQYLMLLFCILVAGTASAFLPPDASAREPQIRAYRQQVREKYEERKAAQYEHAVQAYEQTRADVFTPPWLRGKAQEAERLGVDPAAAERAENAQKRKHRILTTIMFLILIGSGVGWVRYATKKQNE